MTRKEFAAALASCTGITDKEARAVIDCVFSPDNGIIASELAAGRDFSVIGFGKFSTRSRQARTGRNPRTGEEITIAASTVPAFKAGAGLRKRVNS